jgi:hypothetical protein
MVIPAEITAKHGVSQEEVFRKGSASKGIDDAVFELATIANDHVVTAREMFGGKVPRVAMPIFGAGASYFFFWTGIRAKPIFGIGTDCLFPGEAARRGLQRL